MDENDSIRKYKKLFILMNSNNIVLLKIIVFLKTKLCISIEGICVFYAQNFQLG